MSENDLSSEVGSVVSQELEIASIQSVGQRLASARESIGMSVSDAAKVLKFSVRQVVALESDDWSNLPGNTIARGFVRNYARLVGLDAGELMQELDRLEVSLVSEFDIPEGTKVPVPQEGQVERRDYVRVIAGLLVLVLAIFAYFFVPPELLNSTISALKSATQSKGEGQIPQIQMPRVDPSVSVVAPSTQAPQTESSGATDQQPDVRESSSTNSLVNNAASENALRFSFAQPSWVEVRDRSGEVVFSQLCQAGSQQEVEGQPPYNLVIGNASNVSLQYKGKPIDLSKRSKDDVARVTVE